MAPQWQRIGIIGGTGLEDPHIMARSGEVRVETPYGRPSDALIEGNVAGVPCVLLSRHGRRHQQSPTNINYRANIGTAQDDEARADLLR
ncbi:hypothetical protein niasHT_000359 [Heterodera trifolii]|uniref:S-methyl-5'-thioadenosine phosphorylase n=1 Tax=Heterodera trifolii TaxID=157864 RepID=A0ABD2MC33_9BILA